MPKSGVKVEDNDLGWESIKRNLREMDNVQTKVGLPAEGVPAAGEMTSMSEVATVGAVHEFGAPANNIPERSWLRSAYDENKRRLDQVKAKETGRVIDGKQNARQAIGRVGEWFAAQVKNKIRKGPFAPNLPATILRKGSTKPLIDTGQMIQSITHVET
jgi:hypothetical protein